MGNYLTEIQNSNNNNIIIIMNLTESLRLRQLLLFNPFQKLAVVMGI